MTPQFVTLAGRAQLTYHDSLHMLISGGISRLDQFATREISLLTRQNTSWTNQQLISNTLNFPVPRSIVADTNGVLHAIWTEGIINGNPTPSTNTDIFYSNNAGGRWSAPVSIFRDPAGGSIAGPTSLVVDKQNNVHVTLIASNARGPMNMTHLRRVRGVWETRDIRYQFYARPSTDFELSVDRQGRLHLIFVTFRTTGINPLMIHTIQSEDNGETWSEPSPIAGTEQPVSNPKLVVDQRGTFHAFWMTPLNRGILPNGFGYATSPDGTSWSSPWLFPVQSSGFLVSMIGKVDRQGVLHIVFYWMSAIVRYPTRLYYWNAREQTITQLFNSDMATNPSLEIDSSNLLHVAWTDSLGSGVGIYYSQIQARTSSAPKSSVEKPNTFELFQNYPNPFNPSTVISYQVPVSSAVRLKVYDVLGREVATLVNQRQEAGRYEVRFNAAGLASGVYLYQLSAAGLTQTRKMMVAK